MTNKLLTSWNQQAGLIANQHNDLQKAIGSGSVLGD